MSDGFDLLDKEMREDIGVETLPKIEDPAVVFEVCRKDSDGVKYWVYTVGGRLDGRVIGSEAGGALIGGQCIVVHGKNRPEADALAYEGLIDTIAMTRMEQDERIRRGLDTGKNTGIIADVQSLSFKH